MVNFYHGKRGAYYDGRKKGYEKQGEGECPAVFEDEDSRGYDTGDGDFVGMPLCRAD